MQRRRFLLGSLTAFAGASLPRLAWANVPTAYSWELSPPLDDRDAYIEWMVANRGEDPKLLQQHWSRYEAVVQAVGPYGTSNGERSNPFSFSAQAAIRRSP